MKTKLTFLSAVLSLSICLISCDSSRTNTKREMEETYTEDGDTIDPTEGIGEGNTGHKFMETYEQDTIDNVEQDDENDQ